MHESAAPAPMVWRTNPFIRFFCSIKLGITLLSLILAYASIFSALPQVRGALELTEMQAFRHWLFVLLIVLFCINLTVVTLFRIRWSVVNAGVLTVHTGLLLLCGGSVWYFGTKVEGDVLLESPRIEVFTTGPSPRSVGDLLAEGGQRWDRTMPALGGRVLVEVLDTAGEGLAPVKTASLRVTVGDSPPRELSLATTGENTATLTERLSVRLVTFDPKDRFFDDELPALHYRKAGEGEHQRRIVALPTLPLHRERYSDEGYALQERGGRPAPSKRSTPAVSVGPIRIPTSWFEHWNLPIALQAGDVPFDVQVTGYVPYVGDLETSALPGGESDGPAVSYSFDLPNRKLREALFAANPMQALSESANVEFCWVKDATELEGLARPLEGPHELTIEIADPPVRKVVSVQRGQTVAVEGTQYSMTVVELLPSWPLMSPGYENARSPVARVDVVGPGKSYNRTVVQRFPHLSQDIDEQGMRRREGPYDPNLKLTYRTATDTGYVIIAAGPSIPPTLIVRQPRGQCTAQVLKAGESTPIQIGGMPITFTLDSLMPHARKMTLPLVEPVDFRRPDRLREASAVRLTFKGRGAAANWSESQWCLFRNYPEFGQSEPVFVQPPGGEAWEFIYSRYPRPLGTKLAGRRLAVEYFPGRREVTSWTSDFFAEQPDGRVIPKQVRTNVIDMQGPWSFYQASAATDDWSFTVLGVGNRNGIVPMTLGCVLITLGCLYAFYVKPVLIRRRQAQALAVAAARTVQRGSTGAALPVTAMDAATLRKGDERSKELMEVRR